MLEQVITLMSGADFLSVVANDINMLAGLIDRFLSGFNNLRSVSILLMLLAFILFLFLIIILYVKAIVSFLKSENSAAAQSGSEEDEAAENDCSLTNELELEKELERELERELELSRNEKALNEQRSRAREEQQKENESKEKTRAEKTQAQDAAKKTNVLDLDWKKGKTFDSDGNEVPLQAVNLQYQQSHKSLDELLGLIVNMIGRGVEELKIAQTVMFRNQGENSEDEIIQTIASIKDFIALCLNGRFKNLQSDKPLPAEDEALFHLANGDPSLALALLEALMDNEIEKSTQMPQGDKRDQIFRETSNYAATFGTLASLTDVHLATSSFELAVELNPQNINAWNRIADMYHLTDAQNKAMWAYQNVINLADENLNPQQMANAYKMLSQYYYAQGNSLQAAKYYNASKQYYDSIGINRRLDRKEVEIIEIIESRQNDDLENTVARILANQEMRQYSYA